MEYITDITLTPALFYVSLCSFLNYISLFSTNLSKYKFDTLDKSGYTFLVTNLQFSKFKPRGPVQTLFPHKITSTEVQVESILFFQSLPHVY